MAIRPNTISFAFPTYTALAADATVTNFAQITAYIPATVRRFTSVWVELAFQDVITATGGSITEHRCALRLGAGAYVTITELDDIANSGENMGGPLGPFDFTNLFNAEWAGTSMTVDCQFYFDQNTGTTLGTRNVTAILHVTYEYDDDPAVNPTQIKTVPIPLESLVGALSTSANSNVGSNQIPQLTGVGGMLPEASVVIRDWFIVIDGNEGNNNATTDWTLSCNIDSGTAFSFGVQEAQLGSDRYCWWIYKPTPPSTGAAHQFQMWSSTARLNHACVTLYVTYEFDAATTTRVNLTALLPIEIATPLGIATDLNASRFTREFFIEDPGTIELKQSAFRIHFNTTAAIAGLRWRAGSQAYRAYTHVGNACCGMFCLQQRIDSGSAQGAGISLARGSNTINIDGYATDTTDQATNVSGLVILNFHADVGPEGLGQNTKSIRQVFYQWDALLTARVRFSAGFRLPEFYYWTLSVGFQMFQWVATAGEAITLDCQVAPSEGKGLGYLDIYADAYQSDNERSASIIWMRGRDVFKRHVDDPDTSRLTPEAPRDFRLYTTTACANGIVGLITYHCFVCEVAADFDGTEEGDGSGITVHVHRSDTEEKVAEAVSTLGGAFSALWYDDTVPVYCVAREDTAIPPRAGRSDNGLAVATSTHPANAPSRMLTLPSPLGLYLRSNASLTESSGGVTGWTDSSGNGNHGVNAGTVGADYEADAYGDGTGYGMEPAEVDVGSSSTGRGGIRTPISFTTDAARRNFTAFCLFEVRAASTNGGVIIAFGSTSWSLYEYQGNLRWQYVSNDVVVAPTEIGRRYSLIVVSSTTANGGTKFYIDGKMVFAGVECPTGLAMTEMAWGSAHNTVGDPGLFSLLGAVIACGVFGQAFDPAQVGMLDKLMRAEELDL